MLKPVIDDQVRFVSLRSRDLDMIERTPYAFVKKIIAGEMPGIQIAEAKYAGFRRLVFNVTQPPFNNIKIRHAALHALDASSSKVRTGDLASRPPSGGFRKPAPGL